MVTLIHFGDWFVSRKTGRMQIAEQILAKQVTEGRTPSVQYVFFDEDHIIYNFSRGYANVEDRLQSGAGTTFPVFSITKTFTALSILQLAEEKFLNLDRPVRDYLPDVPIGHTVTVKHLLTHTSGLANPIPINWIHLKDDHLKFNRDRFFQPIILKSAAKTDKPGVRFHYSNVGYVILGQLIEAINNISYEGYVADNILNELELKHDVLSFDIPHAALHATGYHNKGSLSMMMLRLMMNTSKYMGTPAGKWKPFKTVYMNGTSYGGIIANTRGIVKYAQALLRDDSPLIPDEYKKMMFTENMTHAGRPTGMCLSWFRGSYGGRSYFTHAGGGGGYYCELRLYPEIRSGSFVIFNRSGFSDEHFLSRLDGELIQGKAKLFVSSSVIK